MGFWSRFKRKKETQNTGSSKLKPVISKMSCNAAQYLVHTSRCGKNSLGGWDMCPEHVKMWQTVPSDERV